jgi:hypothetical protein
MNADLEFYPREGVSLTAEAKFDNTTRRLSEFNSDFTIKGGKIRLAGEEEEGGDRYSLSYGHRYLRQSDTQGTLSSSYYLTPKLQFKNYIRYKYNTDDLELQQYSLRTDLHCWWLDIGIDLDRKEQGGKDLTFWFSFTLKAFPDTHIKLDHDYEGAKSSY